MTRKKLTRLVIFGLLTVIFWLVVLALYLPHPPRTQEEVSRLEARLALQWEAKDNVGASKTMERLLAARPNDRNFLYNHACLLARMGEDTEALAALGKAVANGFDEAEYAEGDSDLAPLRSDPYFATLMEQARENDRRGFGPVEKTPPLSGVTTLERAPEGGLRYRLRLPPTASAANPARLVIWLHPPGGSGNDLAEALMPLLARQGFALLLPVQKDWRGWMDREAEKLFSRSVPDAASLEGVDARAPVLFGFGAGGQVALTRWKLDPARFGGLVLVTAYPVEGGTFYTDVPNEIMPLPDDPVGRKAPIFVAVGDEGVNVWRQAEQEWGAKGGPPLTLARAEGMGPQWSVTPAVEQALEKWLGDAFPAAAAR